MSMYDNIDKYNEVRRHIQNVEDGFIPENPDKDLLEVFMVRHHFSVTQDECRFHHLLIDEVGQKIYTYPMCLMNDRQWALETMCLVVSLRNMKEDWGKEKDSHKRRKIYSKMNCIKGELNQYVVS